MPGPNGGTFSDNIGRLFHKGLNAKNGKQAVAVAYSEAERGDGPAPPPKKGRKAKTTAKKIEGIDTPIGGFGSYR